MRTHQLRLCSGLAFFWCCDTHMFQHTRACALPHVVFSAGAHQPALDGCVTPSRSARSIVSLGSASQGTRQSARLQAGTAGISRRLAEVALTSVEPATRPGSCPAEPSGSAGIGGASSVDAPQSMAGVISIMPTSGDCIRGEAFTAILLVVGAHSWAGSAHGPCACVQFTQPDQ